MGIKTVSLSGGGLELACQKMLTAGLKFLSDKAQFDWSDYGSYFAKNEDAKHLEKVMRNAVNNDRAGDLHIVVVNWLQFISLHSYGEWLGVAGKLKPQDVYELDDFERENLVLSVEGRLP